MNTRGFGGSAVGAQMIAEPPRESASAVPSQSVREVQDSARNSAMLLRYQWRSAYARASMASRGKRQRPKDRPAAGAVQVPAARMISRRNVDPRVQRIGRGEVIAGSLILLGAVVLAQLQPNTGKLGLAGYGIALMAVVGALGLAFGGYHL